MLLPPAHRLFQGDLRLALALRLIQGLLYGEGARGGSGQFLADDVAHQAVVLDHGGHHQVIQGIEHGLPVGRRGDIQIGGQGGLILDCGEIKARFNTEGVFLLYTTHSPRDIG